MQDILLAAAPAVSPSRPRAAYDNAQSPIFESFTPPPPSLSPLSPRSPLRNQSQASTTSTDSISYIPKDGDSSLHFNVDSHPHKDADTYCAGAPPAAPPTRTSALKRTISGQVKGWTDERPQGARAPTRPRAHSRSSSLLSNGNSVTELSQQLRTRLSYAMVKVHNGWESHTFKEIEGLASPPPYPSPQPPALSGSPRWRQEAALSHPTGMTGGPANGSQAYDPAPFADTLPSSAFRYRPQNLAHEPQHSGSARPNLPSAAPPPPPPPPGASTQRAPAHNAAMEADAVETLLFLASPGNSGRRNNEIHHHHHDYPPSTSASSAKRISLSRPGAGRPASLSISSRTADSLKSLQNGNGVGNGISVADPFDVVGSSSGTGSGSGSGSGSNSTSANTSAAPSQEQSNPADSSDRIVRRLHPASTSIMTANTTSSSSYALPSPPPQPPQPPQPAS